MTDNELELYDVSEERNDERLREDYVSVMKPHTTSKV